MARHDFSADPITDPITVLAHYCADTIETLVEGRADCDRQHYRSGGGVHVFAP